MSYTEEPDSPVSPVHACRMAPTQISSVGLSGRTQAVSEAEPAPAPAPVGTAQRSDSPLGRQIAFATRAPATRISAKAAHRGLGASLLMSTGGASGFRRMRRARSIAALRIAPSRSCGGCEMRCECRGYSAVDARADDCVWPIPLRPL